MSIFRRKKQTDAETESLKSFLDMIAPSIVKFETGYYICGNTFRCIWALREYPTSTDDLAILRHLGEKHGGLAQEIAVKGHGAVLRHHKGAVAQDGCGIAAKDKVRMARDQPVQRLQIAGIIAFPGMQGRHDRPAGGGGGIEHVERAHALERPAAADMPL